MRIDAIAKELGMNVGEVFAACTALDIVTDDGALTELSAADAIDVALWLQFGRFDAVRRKIRAAQTNRKTT